MKIDLTIEQMRQILDGAPNDATHSKVLLGSVGYYFNSSNDESHQAGLWIDDGDNSYWGLSSYQNWELLLADNGFISLDDLRTAIFEEEKNTSDFEEYIVAKYPNRSARVLTHRLEDVDGTMFYACKDVQDQFEVWTHQQSRVDEKDKQIAKALAKWNLANSILKTMDMVIVPDEFLQNLDEVEEALRDES
ncbi:MULTISPECIES: hypothetical protein [unclassified Acinetobacter]|uniref:hypothetical protein n=1 Tax=unclassified Acinetobacter TaxID=196816 RepID=UPI0029342EE0|nr:MULTISPECIES: hypothetical protein [unclassified Acinetobacter]WOE31961.1 hypothetical protein QSG84_01670 [Acinetobacter sp. SAAs470]WOE37429.1 hypothetical protein QSG86_10715 [Acinetobacter sp. SAAs474]